ncbi:MAG: adenosylcobinamide-phosphate synthase CbiB [Nitrospira sp.]
MTGSELVLAAVVDLTVGDPRWLPHPVRAMGWIIGWCDDHVRGVCRTAIALKIAGLVLAIGLPTVVYMLGQWVVLEAGAVAGWLGTIVVIGLAATTLAGRDLWEHGRAVSGALQQGDLLAARQAVSMIVGRDTHQLTESGVARAAVETVAESTADGVIAPLFYLMLGGPALALAYKAVNTLDSMIGHRDERYLNFGWASARLDDVANWIPARLAAVLLVVATGFVTLSHRRVRNSARIWWRDGGKHPSPNSGRPEAAMAGALGVQLGGINDYDGVAHERPVLGDVGRDLNGTDITLATQLMAVASLLGVLIGAGVLWLI